MNPNISIFIILIFSFANLQAQTNVDVVLESISKNNKTLLAERQYRDALSLQYRTGLSLHNPTVNYEYLTGTPASAGDQNEFTATQSFDFPSAYIKKKQVSDKKLEQLQNQGAYHEKNIMLQARKTCLELIYRNKLQAHYLERKTNSEKVLASFQKLLDTGEANILDLNKAKLQWIEAKRSFDENTVVVNSLNQKLIELNGGIDIKLESKDYPLLPTLVPYDQLANEYINADPLRISMDQEKQISSKEVELSKALALPKFEAGYRYVGIPQQEFHGFHAGITIPLWEDKNKVKMQKAMMVYSDLRLQDHVNESRSEIAMLYQKYNSLKESNTQYEQLIGNNEIVSLLNKSLSLGQISRLEYFMELSFYYAAFEKYLENEKEVYLVVAEMRKFE